MNKEKVSVLMTVYNCEDVIPKSAKSILEQTYSNIEFIIVNDGSTDHTGDILEKLASSDNRILLINRHINMGRAYSLNEGLAAVKTKFLFINDADDISNSRRIEKTMSFFEKNVRDQRNWGIIGTASRTVDVVNQTTSNYNITFGSLGKQVIPTWRVYVGMPFIHSSFMYNTEYLRKIGGFSNEVSSLIDYFTLSKIANIAKIYGIDEILVERYVTGNNYFMTEKVLEKRSGNIKIIREWQKNNYRYNWIYKKINGVKKIIKRKDI